MLYMQEGEPPLNPIGLHELTGEEMASVIQYVDAYGAADLRDSVQEEWQALPSDHQEVAATAVADLVAGNDYLKQFACKIVARVAEQDPDAGFDFWRSLAKDESREVRVAASDALLESLGRLSLDPKGVAGLIKALWEAEREHGGL